MNCLASDLHKIIFTGTSAVMPDADQNVLNGVWETAKSLGVNTPSDIQFMEATALINESSHVRTQLTYITATRMMNEWRKAVNEGEMYLRATVLTNN